MCLNQSSNYKLINDLIFTSSSHFGAILLKFTQLLPLNLMWHISQSNSRAMKRMVKMPWLVLWLPRRCCLCRRMESWSSRTCLLLLRLVTDPDFNFLHQVFIEVMLYGCTTFQFFPIPVKVWANTILTIASPVCLTVRLTVRSHWARYYHCMVNSSLDLTNSSQQAHGVSCKFTESSEQAHSVSSPYKLTVR